MAPRHKKMTPAEEADWTERADALLAQSDPGAERRRLDEFFADVDRILRSLRG